MKGMKEFLAKRFKEMKKIKDFSSSILFYQQK